MVRPPSASGRARAKRKKKKKSPILSYVGHTLPRTQFTRPRSVHRLGNDRPSTFSFSFAHAQTVAYYCIYTRRCKMEKRRSTRAKPCAAGAPKRTRRRRESPNMGVWNFYGQRQSFPFLMFFFFFFNNNKEKNIKCAHDRCFAKKNENSIFLAYFVTCCF